MTLSTLPRRSATAIPRVRPDLPGRRFSVFADRDAAEKIELPEEAEALAALSDEELQATEQKARDAIAAIKDQDEITADDVAEAKRLKAIVVKAKETVADRAQAADNLRKELDDLELDDDADGDTDAADDAAGDDQGDGGDPDDGDDQPADDAADADTQTKEPVLAGANGGRTGGRAARAARRSTPPKPPANQKRRSTITAAADVPGVKANHVFGNFGEVAKAANKRLASYPQRALPSSNGSGTRLQHGIAVIQREFAPELVADYNDFQVLEYAASESRLPGGSLIKAREQRPASLVAAGGWCAPAETLFDLEELESPEGVLDLPEINPKRGAVNVTPGPDFRAIYDGAGFFQTEAQAIAGETKSCYRVPCPDFGEVRADAIGVCITSGILQNHAFPELTARVTRGALVAHEHKISARSIAKLVAGSTAVTIGAAESPLGATASILSTIELAATDVRYRHRMPINATLEAVFPLFTWGVIRADLSQRLGVELLSVTNAMILAWFALRGIAAQFVYDWQDSALGQVTAAHTWPTTLQFLIYPAGTWVRGRQEIITLDTVYDSAGLVENDYVGLFTEEELMVVKMGHDSRIYTVPTPADGTTRAGVALAAA